jgi:serine/threonine protein kinase
MGEVYRARDTRLGRDVALKVLPVHLCSDPELRQRMEREAQTISSLNHPNICQLYDVGSQDEIDFIVMEYLDGQTLADQLKSGPLPLKLALKIAIDIADALDKAHANGIVHRDLKPGNIMLTGSGASKLMDFGLAKLTPAKATTSQDATARSTVTTSIAELIACPNALTQRGTVLGTYLYMAPEVLQGQRADAQSDIFSLGCVLYEMITGQSPFARQSQLSVITAILECEPEPVTSRAKLTPPSLNHIVLRCLAKDPGERWQSARDLRGELRWVAESSALTRDIKPATRAREWTAWAVAFVSILLVGWLAFALFRPLPHQRQPLRLSIMPPPSTSFVPYNLAISPDGQRLAFVAARSDGSTGLWVRALAAGSAQQLTGTEGALYPFWSADSRQIGFFSGAKLKKVDPGTGAVQIICDLPFGYGATWNTRGVILYGNPGSGPVYKVDAAGGTPQAVTKATGSQVHRWPVFLPDQQHFLYFVDNTEETGDRKGIYVGSLSSMESKLVSSEIANNIQFTSGDLYFAHDRSLVSQHFDVTNLELTGSPRLIIQQELEPDPAFSQSDFSVSRNGVVVFGSAADAFSRLTWFNRAGQELETIPALGYRDPALSRDGRLLIVSSDDDRNGKHFIRLYDAARSNSARITDTGSDIFPLLSPDSKRVAYTTGAERSIFTVAADNSRKPEMLIEGRGLMPNDWSSDGRYLLFMNSRGEAQLNVYDFQEHSQTVFTTGAEAQFSPGGHWVAFTGSGAGQNAGNYQDSEIFVSPFPGPGSRIQVSNHGGAQPRWRGDGKELFYIGLDKKLWAVSIDTARGKVEAGVPHALFQTRITAARIVLFQYTVSPDGKRFLINSLPAYGAAPITVLIN